MSDQGGPRHRDHHGHAGRGPHDARLGSAADEQQPDGAEDEETHSEPRGQVMGHHERCDAGEREEEGPLHPRLGLVDRVQQEVDDPGREGEGERLVGVLGVEGIELWACGVDENADTAGPRGRAHALDDEEHGQHEHDARGKHDCELGQHEGQTRRPLRRRREKFQARVVGAHRQEGVRREQGARVDHPGQRREV